MMRELKLLNIQVKIDKATAAQITNKTFYIDTLKWDEKIWYLDDVAGGKRPRLKAEGDVYGAEEEDTSKERARKEIQTTRLRKK